MPPAPKPRGDIFWIKPHVWIKAQHVLGPPAPEALAPTSHKETLVTAGRGQGPETGPDGGPEGLATSGPFSQHQLFPQEGRPRREGRGTHSRGFTAAVPCHCLGLLSPLGPGMCPRNSTASRILTPTSTWHQQKIPYLLKPQPQGSGVTREVFTKALRCCEVGACLPHPA